MREATYARHMSRHAHGRDLRRGRCSLENQIYMVTAVTYQRMPLFSELMTGRVVVHEIRRSDLFGQTDTLAFVIMPDHIHWLFTLLPSKSLSTVVGSIKRHSARLLNTDYLPHKSRVWQRGFHDRALRSDENVLHIARYIVANPLRAGLVRRIGDYSLWDAAWI